MNWTTDGSISLIHFREGGYSRGLSFRERTVQLNKESHFPIPFKIYKNGGYRQNSSF